MEPRPLQVQVGARAVPTVIWRTPQARGLVLLGHGGGGGSHKLGARQQLLASCFVDAGLAVVSIDGPAHGDRAPRPGMAPGAYQTDLVERGVDAVVRDMVDDWLAALDAAGELLAGESGVGYLGMSMGARFGLPLAAELGERLSCAVLGKFGLQQSARLHPGLHDATELVDAARRVVAPTLWHVQWDDELFARDGQLELFDRIAARDKQLIAFPGDHGTTTQAAIDAWVTFVAGHLAPA